MALAAAYRKEEMKIVIEVQTVCKTIPFLPATSMKIALTIKVVTAPRPCPTEEGRPVIKIFPKCKKSFADKGTKRSVRFLRKNK